MAQQVNRNGANVTSPDWSIQALKRMTFTGKTGAGAVGAATLFSVTGAVLVRLFGKIVSVPSGISASISPSASVSASVSPSLSPSASASSSQSRSISPSSSRSPSSSASASPSPSRSPSASTSLSPSSSLSPSASRSPSASASVSVSPSISPSSSASASTSPSASRSPSASISPSSSVSASPSSGSVGEISVGTATQTTALIAATETSALVAGRLWVDATPTTTVEAVASVSQFVVSEDIIQTVTTEAIGDGVIDYYCSWYPLSADSTLVAA